MSQTDAAAIRAFPELAGLIALIHAGWLFLPPRTTNGEPVEVDGFRARPDGWTDAIRVRSPTDSMALRSDGGEPPGIVWERTGTLIQVVEGLLGLPAPDTRLAPRLVPVRAPRLWVSSQ